MGVNPFFGASLLIGASWSALWNEPYAGISSFSHQWEVKTHLGSEAGASRSVVAVLRQDKPEPTNICLGTSITCSPHSLLSVMSYLCVGFRSLGVYPYLTHLKHVFLCKLSLGAITSQEELSQQAEKKIACNITCLLWAGKGCLSRLVYKHRLTQNQDSSCFVGKLDQADFLRH